MQRTNITWPWPHLHTLNPLVGCVRNCTTNGKPWCYAKKLHDKRHAAYLDGKKLPVQYAKPFEAIQWFPERLKDLDCKKGKNVFIGSVSDIAYWPLAEKQAVVDAVRKNPQHTCMFLTKDPDKAYGGINWPNNAILGLTLTCEQVIVELQEFLIFKIRQYPRIFLSIEPLLGTLKTDTKKDFEYVICGAMSGRDAIRPDPRWIQSVIKHTDPDKLYWKDNIKEYLCL